jgi:hypothetical protein
MEIRDMKTVNAQSAHSEAQNVFGDGGRILASLSWQLIRLPVYTTLVILEPVVAVIFGGVALLGVLISLLFKFSGGIPNFPFWTVFLISIGFGFVPMIYGGVIRFFSR